MTASKLNTIGDRIKYARISQNLSQRQVAEQMGVNQKTVSNMEKNSGFSTPMLDKIERVLNVDHNWLRRGVGIAPEPAPKPKKSVSYKEEIERLTKTVGEMTLLFVNMNDNITRLTGLVESLVESQSPRS